MNRIPVIDVAATGLNITRLRVNAGLTVKDLQDIFGFNTPQAIYKWQRGTALPTVILFAVSVTERPILSVTLPPHFDIRNKPQGGAVDTVPQSAPTDINF